MRLGREGRVAGCGTVWETGETCAEGCVLEGLVLVRCSPFEDSGKYVPIRCRVMKQPYEKPIAAEMSQELLRGYGRYSPTD